MKTQSWLALTIAIFIPILMMQSVNAQTTLSQLKRDRQQSALTLDEWKTRLQTQAQNSQNSMIEVVKVTLIPTAEGLEIVLETKDRSPLTINTEQFKVEGNALVADLSNALLALPEGKRFEVENPIDGVAKVRVIQQDDRTIQVRAIGTTAPPTRNITLKVNDLAYSLNPDQQDEEEITVTGQREGSRYVTPNATSATRTDTPIRDTPASIQVIPKKVIRDQQVVSLDEALRNVSGVGSRGAGDSRGFNFYIRGFDNAPQLRDGFRLFSTLQGFPELANLEQIEVLKGPASILFGDVQPGGIINLVSKQPLSKPFYDVELQVGSRNFVRPRFDFSGPVTEDGKVLYRLNTLYQKNDSSRDFTTQFRRLAFAPTLTWKVSDRTDFTTFFEYIDDEGPADFGQLIIGDRIAQVPRRRTTNDPDDSVKNKYLRIGYSLEHRFSNNWKVRNSFTYQRYSYDYNVITLPFTFNPRTNILSRTFVDQDGTIKTYAFQTNVVGKFKTGAIQHTLLAGIDLARSDVNLFTLGDFSVLRPFNIFAPDYRRFPKPDRSALPLNSDATTRGDRLGIFIQDQLSLFSDRLILLAGLRYDTIDQTVTNVQTRFTRASKVNQQDTAVTPRLGILYRILPELSIYGSYSRSFNPNSGTTVQGNLLEPETGEGLEAGLKVDLLKGKLFATAAYFDLKKQNIAVADPQFLGFFIPTGEQRSRGVELDIAGEILPGWNIVGNYAYTNAEVTNDSNPARIGSRLANIPKHSSGLWTTYEVQTGGLKGLGFGIGFNYVGERFGGLPNSFRADAYWLGNAGVFYRTGKWRFAINIRNFTNTNYVQALATTSRVRANYVGEPLTVLGSISLEF
jgi:iron complex outermembrane receptor protein